MSTISWNWANKEKMFKNLHVATYLEPDFWKRRDHTNFPISLLSRLLFSGPWRPWVGRSRQWWEVEQKVCPYILLLLTFHPVQSALLSFVFHTRILRDFVGGKKKLLGFFSSLFHWLGVWQPDRFSDLLKMRRSLAVEL